MPGSTTKVLRAAQSCKSLRNPSRIFFWIAQNVGSKCHISALSGNFSKHEIKNYLHFLARRGWIGRNKQGDIYLRSVSTILKREGVERGNGKLRRIFIPAEMSDSRQKWNDFLHGVPMLDHALGLRTGITKKRSRCYAADNNAGNPHIITSTPVHSSIAQGLSLSLIAKKHGVHPSTASRWRKRGQAAGYELVKAYYKTGLTGNTMAHLEAEKQMAREADVYAGDLVLFKGRILRQAPSLICTEKIIIFR